MTDKAVLFIDDEAADLPSPEYQKLLAERFGLRSYCANPHDPICSGLALLARHPDIVAIATDKCKRPAFEHVKQMRRLRPNALIAVHSGSVGNQEREEALSAGADLCFRKADDLDEFFKRAAEKAQDWRQLEEDRQWAVNDAEVRRRYQGKTIAIQNRRVVAAGRDYSEVSEEVRRISRAGKGGASFVNLSEQDAKLLRQQPTPISAEYRRASQRFRLELPKLLADTAKLGVWVAFTPDGQVGESRDELELIRLCEAKGLISGAFVVTRVLPEFGPIDQREGLSSDE